LPQQSPLLLPWWLLPPAPGETLLRWKEAFRSPVRRLVSSQMSLSSEQSSEQSSERRGALRSGGLLPAPGAPAWQDPLPGSALKRQRAAAPATALPSKVPRGERGSRAQRQARCRP